MRHKISNTRFFLVLLSYVVPHNNASAKTLTWLKNQKYFEPAHSPRVGDERAACGDEVTWWPYPAAVLTINLFGTREEKNIKEHDDYSNSHAKQRRLLLVGCGMMVLLSHYKVQCKEMHDTPLAWLLMRCSAHVNRQNILTRRLYLAPKGELNTVHKKGEWTQ